MQMRMDQRLFQENNEIAYKNKLLAVYQSLSSDSGLHETMINLLNHFLTHNGDLKLINGEIDAEKFSEYCSSEQEKNAYEQLVWNDRFMEFVEFAQTSPLSELKRGCLVQRIMEEVTVKNDLNYI